jgi:hypothetical protein
MAKKSNIQKPFNLLYPFEPQKTKIDKVYDWVMGTGRIIVVLFMLMVIGSFIYRFPLDKELNDQIERSKSNLGQLQYYFDTNESDFRSIVKRISEADKFIKIYDPTQETSQIVFSEALATIRASNDKFKDDISITSYNYTADSGKSIDIVISGTASSSAKADAFREELSTKDKGFYQVLINNYGTAVSLKPQFTINIKVKNIQS